MPGRSFCESASEFLRDVLLCDVSASEFLHDVFFRDVIPFRFLSLSYFRTFSMYCGSF